MDKFEDKIRELTKPVNGQLPRPWMTKMRNPLEADVFIVGRNQSTRYSDTEIQHQRHLDALFNRNGESCRGLYDEVTKGKPSRTRRKMDDLAARLNQRNIHNILETDVVCYSTPMSADLTKQANAGGARRGKEIFRYLLAEIAPAVLIVHGAGSVEDISRVLEMDQLIVPRSTDDIFDVQTERHLIIPVPSLAPPAFNKWSSWSDGYLDKVADRVHEKLATR